MNSANNVKNLMTKEAIMRKTVLIFGCMALLSSLTMRVQAQWSWQGSLYFGVNQNLAMPVNINGDVDVTVAESRTVRAPQAVKGNGHTLTKKGGGVLWFQAHNPAFDADIVYAGKADTVRLTGTFGVNVGGETGYLYEGALSGSPDSLSLFHIHQNADTVQTLDAYAYGTGYAVQNTNLYILHDTESTLRIIRSSDSLCGTVRSSGGGVLYMDGSNNATIRVDSGSRLITGENSVDSHADYATFASHLSYPAIGVYGSTMQIGARTGPSLVNVSAGDVTFDGGVLHIDVYDPNGNYTLTNVAPGWQGSFSDKIYLKSGNFSFAGTMTMLDVAWSDAYLASVAQADTFYLPVIMTYTTTQQITNADQVRFSQPLPGRYLRFVIGDGTDGTTVGWGYIMGVKIPPPDNIITSFCAIGAPGVNWSICELPINKDVLVYNYGPLTTGDIDGDGVVEIIGFMPKEGTQNNYDSDGLRTFYVEDGAVKHKKDILFNNHTASTLSSMALARYNNTGYIVLVGVDGCLHAYDAFTSAELWKTEPTGLEYVITSSVADFNGDGIPEVYAGNRIYSLASGELLCSGGNNNTGKPNPRFTVAADMDGDGLPELCAGTQIYRVTIPSGATTAGSGNMTVISDMQLPQAAVPANAVTDGHTLVVDIDLDGKLEVVVVSNPNGQRVVAYVWKPLPGNASWLLGSYEVNAMPAGASSLPMIGNIDGDAYPEIVFITGANTAYNPNDSRDMYALEYIPTAAPGNQISEKWTLPHTDPSGMTGMSLFDFNLDGINEIVYRDENTLRIINGNTTQTPQPLNTFNNVRSGTLRELPLIADVDGDGQAEIIIQGWDGQSNPNVGGGGINANGQNGYLRVFKSGDPATPWSPARKVWNQYVYNAVNVNNDLTIPRVQLNPATVFPGADGQLNTADDVRPYNGFLMQQMALGQNGIPIMLAPDAALASTTTVSADGDDIVVNVAVVNLGQAALSPVCVSLYGDDFSNFIKSECVSHMALLPGDTAFVTVDVEGGNYMNIIVVVNRDGSNTDLPEECNMANNDTTLFTPAVSTLMEKHAKILGEDELAHDGSYANPVSVLFNEEIEYTIKATKIGAATHATITDTLPFYLDYVPADVTPGVVHTTVTESGIERDIVTWTDTVFGAASSVEVKFRSTPHSGTVASQPLFINRAWVKLTVSGDSLLRVPTGNSTYHQGAGVSIVTFSAGYGGSLYNAQEQALDYKTSPRSGILVVPDNGYRFAGWSHGDYVSLRGARIHARDSIAYYDTLTVYGNLELRANFAPEEYPITYRLHGGTFASGNPAMYTVNSSQIVLSAPSKQGDEFIGWTGANGDVPALEVTIPRGSTGALEYFANYLYSGRENVTTPLDDTGADRVWAVKSDLYIHTVTPAALIRIYTIDGVLCDTRTLSTPGETIIRLSPGIYVVTVNGGIGQKVMIE